MNADGGKKSNKSMSYFSAFHGNSSWNNFLTQSREE